MTTEMKVPTIAEIRARIAEGLSTELMTTLPRMTTMRIHASGEERVPLFTLASACRFISEPLEKNSDDARLAQANERFLPVADALLEGIEQKLEPAEMYALVDRMVTASAAANRSLLLGEGVGGGHPSPHED